MTPRTERGIALVPSATLVIVAVAAFAVDQVVSGVVVLLLAVGAAVAAHHLLPWSPHWALTVFVVVFAQLGVLVTAGAVADAYFADRLARCHEPSATVRHLVQGVARPGIGPLVAVRHRHVTYVAGTVPGEPEPAVFGTSGDDIRSINEVARDDSTAAFDFLYGLNGQIVVRGDTGHQDARRRAIARVGACAAVAR